MNVMQTDVYNKRSFIVVACLGKEIFKVEVWIKKTVFLVHAKLPSSDGQLSHKPIHQWKDLLT